MAVGGRSVPGGDGRPIDWVLGPVQRFLRIEAAGGFLLLGCTAIALIWANSPWRESYDSLWHTSLSLGFGEQTLELSLAHFVNDRPRQGTVDDTGRTLQI